MNLNKEHQSDVARMEKMIMNIYSISCIKYWYFKLKRLKISFENAEGIMDHEGLTSSIVIAYGRLFNSGQGATKLDDKMIPKNLKNTHEEIMDLRNKKFAHHGGHETVKPKLDITVNEQVVYVNPEVASMVLLEAPQNWEMLFVWLEGKLLEMINKQLSSMSKKTGKTWKIRAGNPPSWM